MHNAPVSGPGNSLLPNTAQRAILESIFASITDSLLVLDSELRVIEANNQLLEQIRRSREEVIGQNWLILFPHLGSTGREEELRAVLKDGHPHRGRVPVMSYDGESHLFDVSTYPVFDQESGVVTHLVEFAREITEEVQMQLQVMDAHMTLLRTKEALEEKTVLLDNTNTLVEEKCRSLEAVNRRLERLAVIDVMTELPNHRAFQENLTYQIQQTDRRHRPFSLIIFDVDNFKLYNDRYGHPEGDKLLAAVAALIRATIRVVDIPARYGGEEFAVILPETDRYGAAVVAERIRSVISEYNFPHSSVTVSVGVAEYPKDASDAGGIVFCADKAMYHAKSNGKNSVSLWRGVADPQKSSSAGGARSMNAMIRRCQPVPGLPSHLANGSASGSRLLLVDQDELSLGALADALSSHGFAVSCAGSGHEALDALAGAAGGFDLMLTDVALPDKDGMELRASARVLSPNLPVIFTSSYANPALLRQVLADESCQFLAKPFHSDALIRLIDSFLGGRITSPIEPVAV